ncbi:winged helix-turn-helix transcriptional regulator, partial [Rhodoplanes sp. SY1]|uniref:winged helix-turn-helix transcriptional regulator n=1 Tax=Rhodoplanes sp. SY1 TaxID=3166646 RepID=UPI0038B54A47
DLERAIPAVSQKMLAQQLRQMERDGLVRRTVHPQVPPKVEYGLTDWGQALCPALDALLTWAALRDGASAAAAPREACPRRRCVATSVRVGTARPAPLPTLRSGSRSRRPG